MRLKRSSSTENVTKILELSPGRSGGIGGEKEFKHTCVTACGESTKQVDGETFLKSENRLRQ